MAVALAGVFLLVPAVSRAGALGDALDALGDAIDEVQDEGGRCKREVLEALTDTRGDLKDLRRDFSKSDAKKAKRSLEKALDAAEDECPKKVVRAIEESLEAIEDALEDEDDDRGGGSRKKKNKAPPCWNARDPGCNHTKNGNYPMNKAAFDSFLSGVRGAKPHVYPMQDMVKSMIGNQYLTSLQLSLIVEEFKPHVYPMQDVVKICAPRLVDPQNGGVVSTQFKPHVFPMQDVAALISAQRAD